jgi:hypothetical protein
LSCVGTCGVYSIAPLLDTIMHRALALFEIDNAIIDAVSLLDPPFSTLRSLALTSRLFTKRALDHLWSTAPLYSLALLMPEEFRKVFESEYRKHVRICIYTTYLFDSLLSEHL